MDISTTLSGGDPRSLGRTEEVVKLVLTDQQKLGELFACLSSTDEIIRMRAGDALEKVCRDRPKWFEPYKNRLLDEVSKIKQPSVQWHLAQILAEISLNQSEQQRAIKILENNLNETDDWIVTNLTLESLAKFTREGALDRLKFAEALKQFQSNKHKSVVSRVKKLQKEFANG